MKTKYLVFTLAVILLPISLFALVNWYQRRVAALPVLDRPRISFQLQDQEGRVVSASVVKNKLVVANFFFTRCPSVCPRMMAQMQRIARRFSQREDVVLLSYSVDPERDKISALAGYARRFQAQAPQWHLLTGDKRQIYRLARNSFHIEASEGDGGPQDFMHSDRLVLLDASGAIRGYYEGVDPISVTQLMHDIDRLHSNVDQ